MIAKTTGLAAALLTATTLVAAPAAHASCPYQGCANTRTLLTGPDTKITKNTKGTYHAQVKVVGSNAKAAGTLRFVIKGNGGAHPHFFYAVEKPTSTGVVDFKTPKMPVGIYTVQVNYKKKDNSAFFGSHAGPRDLKVR